MDVFPSAWFGNTKEHLRYIFAWFSYTFYTFLFSFFFFYLLSMWWSQVNANIREEKETCQSIHTEFFLSSWQSPGSMMTTILKSCSIRFYFFLCTFGWCEKSLAWINSVTATENKQARLPTAATYWHTHKPTHTLSHE